MEGFCVLFDSSASGNFVEIFRFGDDNAVSALCVELRIPCESNTFSDSCSNQKAENRITATPQPLFYIYKIVARKNDVEVQYIKELPDFK